MNPDGEFLASMDSGTGPIAIIAAMRREVAALVGQLSGRRRLAIRGLAGWRGHIGNREVIVALSGIGPQRAGRAARALLAARMDVAVIVSVGFAGGLDPDLLTGDLLAATEIRSCDGGAPIMCDTGWTEAACARAGAVSAPLVTVPLAASTPAAKGALRTAAAPRPPAAGVDMEAYEVGLAARAAGVSFTALKVVLDPAGEALSLSPSAWPRLARASYEASRRLFDALMHLSGAGPVRPGWPVLSIAARLLFGPAAANPLTVAGAATLPPGPKILAFNHQSWLDVCVVYAACPFKVHWVAKAELFGPPLVRWFVTAMGALPLERGRGKDLSKFAAALARGGTVVIFPEGTIPGEESVPRTAVLAETGLLRGKGGAVRMALQTGVPLIPVGISGTGRALPPEAAPHLERFPWPRRGIPLKVCFGPPLDLCDPDDTPSHGAVATHESVRAATDRLMKAIAALVDPEDLAFARQFAQTPAPPGAPRQCAEVRNPHAVP